MAGLILQNLLLDTNAYTSLMMGDRNVLDTLAEAENVLMSVFVLGELYDGFKGGSRQQENIETLQRFLTKEEVKMYPATQETSRIFGDIKQELKKAGNPIPINDVWIASHARQSGSILLTFDTHFAMVPGLRLWGA